MMAGTAAVPAVILVALWWWAALATAIAVQPGRTAMKCAAISVIPAIAALSLFVAIVVGLVGVAIYNP
jgi:hypothetical protein